MARYQKGQSGNPAGRPEGAKNRVNDEIRTRINTFLDENFETIQSDIKDLEPRERVRFYIELLQYGVPKLKQTELKTEPVNLPPLRIIFKDLNEPDDEELLSKIDKNRQWQKE